MARDMPDRGGGMHGKGHTWQAVCVVGACMAGGMCGKEGGVHGKGNMCGRRDGHCSGRYVSYWNAFLLLFAS